MYIIYSCDRFEDMSNLKKAIIIGTPLAIIGGLAYSKYKSTRDQKHFVLLEEDKNNDTDRVPENEIAVCIVLLL